MTKIIVTLISEGNQKMSTIKKKSKAVGCLLIISTLFASLFLFLFSGDIFRSIKHSVCPPIRVYITKPGWDCDDNDESFSIVKTEYPNSWSKKLFPKESFLKPYPAGRYGDTTSFSSYYKKTISSRGDTIMLIGKFGLETTVGVEKSILYRCDPIPYFEAKAVYTKLGKLIRKF